jgi:hypothetical protein
MITLDILRKVANDLELIGHRLAACERPSHVDYLSKTDAAEWLKAIRDDVASTIEPVNELLKASQKFLETWRRAGPLGSHQFEKFDVAVRMATVAVENVAGTTDDPRLPT